MKTRAAAKPIKIVRLEAGKRWPGQLDEVAVENRSRFGSKDARSQS
jgi:hypothetical protein